MVTVEFLEKTFTFLSTYKYFCSLSNISDRFISISLEVYILLGNGFTNLLI